MKLIHGQFIFYRTTELKGSFFVKTQCKNLDLQLS